jgi:hypothetical protein
LAFLRHIVVYPALHCDTDRIRMIAPKTASPTPEDHAGGSLVHEADIVNAAVREKILPPYLRKAQSVEELFPWPYLKGISTGDNVSQNSASST